MATLRELVAGRENDYGSHEARYAAATGGELVRDPFGSYARGPVKLTRSASVVIGTHDSIRSLVPALVSIERSSLNLRRPDLLEVIVVDDGSTDGTRETLLDLELDLRWRYVRQRRGGLTRAHNTGLAFTDGDVVVFSDSDVVHTPYALEELMKRHEVLPHVTLVGFRYDVDPADLRLERERLPRALAAEPPAFWRDFRLSFPGWPANVCRDTEHLRELGRGRRVWLANGARYDLAGMVVGAFFSIERADLVRFGGSDERLVGWGCEDSLIGARSLALGNPIVPVYPAAAWHVWHPRRDPSERAEFGRNLLTLERIYDEPFGDRPAEFERWRARALEVVERGHPGAARGEPPAPYPPPGELDRARAAEAVGRYRDALEHLAGAESAAGHAARSRCLRALGDADAAVAAAETAVALAPDEGEALFALALARAASGDYRRAREPLDERLRRDWPPFESTWTLRLSAEEHKRRGNEHARQGLHRIAVTDFDLALVVDPDCVWAHFDRALSLRALDRRDEAFESLRRADELLHPEDANRTWIHSALADVLARRGERGAARAQLARALELYPGNEEARALAAALGA